eukprot:CAMPEP_0184644514 /NCGR_PEP_ID=MMETSP0308-20130426/1222_1 /TAXON_ID=38269 /ORGANISM="Gloeochaete witrockiana, Strain SAG 46.84" /LENGTH=53 /DNA_ID=CAMNT_0027073089 /DNA_START=718 /DNA_END=879 /DNA_ORIENTATION=-
MIMCLCYRQKDILMGKDLPRETKKNGMGNSPLCDGGYVKYVRGEGMRGHSCGL